jgi:parallel beta helix pectate lyase-like protein
MILFGNKRADRLRRDSCAKIDFASQQATKLTLISYCFTPLMAWHCLSISGWLVLLSGFSVSAATYEVAQRNPQAGDDGDGTRKRPWKTISRAAEKAGPGDTVVIRDGIYRERVAVNRSGAAEAPISFDAAPGAHAELSGADRLTGWQEVQGGLRIYQVPWKHRFVGWSRQMTHPDDEYHRLIGRCEQVAIDGYLLRQVLESNQLAPGTFFVDISNQVLFARDSGNRDLNKVLVEASVRQEILRVEGDYVQLRGLRFRFAANMAQHGAVVLAGKHDTLEDCIIEDMNASGATFSGERHMVRRCVFRNNGQLGFGANGAHDLLFTECLVENNNTKSFDRGWEAGGNKLVLCRNAVLERSQFLRNRGNGVWFDIGNERCVVRRCLIAENEDSGIFYEISYGLQAHDNVIIGNGFAATAGAWGAQAGISISSSPECVIERNLILGNREGFNFREQTRTTTRINQKGETPIWNHDEWIRRNIIALNRDAQIWGWFDVKDDRHWPARGKEHEATRSGDGDATKPGDIARPDASKESDRNTEKLTLEKLRLSFVENIFFAEPGQGWFEWGVSWGRHKSYRNLSDFETDLGIDVRSRVFNPGFANLRALDCSLSSEAMTVVKQCFPHGLVPGVILGAQR